MNRLSLPYLTSMHPAHTPTILSDEVGAVLLIGMNQMSALVKCLLVPVAKQTAKRHTFASIWLYRKDSSHAEL